MSTGYLLVYLQHHKGNPPPHPPSRETVVLRDIHPLVWASWPHVFYREHFWVQPLSWQEFACPQHVWKAIIAGNVLSAESLDGLIETADEDLDHNADVPDHARARLDALQRDRHAALVAYRLASRRGTP